MSDQINFEHTDALSQILEMVSCGIYFKDCEGRMVGCNSHFLNMVGLSDSRSAAGLPEKEFWHRLAEQPGPSAADPITTPLGFNNKYSISERPLKGRDGKPSGSVCVCRCLAPEESTLPVAAEIEETAAVFGAVERDQLIENKNQQFRSIANQVAHDIASPLAALSMIIPGLTDVPEAMRSTLKQAVTRIEDIAGQLLRQFNSQNHMDNIEPVKMFVSMELLAVLSEKRIQYGKAPVRFVEDIDDDACFAFISVNRSDWQRMLSNLINNAVDSFSGRAGCVRISLKVADGEVVMAVSDDGKGMSTLLTRTILKCIPVTQDKKNGHGIGLSQVAGVLQRNQGRLEIASSLGGGTRMTVSFPLVEQPEWAATQLILDADQIVLVLDDDEFIHGAWDARFKQILEERPNLKLMHFTKGDEMLVFLALLSETDLQRVYLLSDYELLKQEMNGLDMIEQLKMSRATLVTSHYANSSVIERAAKLNIRVLPKRLAPKVPILLRTR